MFILSQKFREVSFFNVIAVVITRVQLKQSTLEILFMLVFISRFSVSLC